MILSKRPEIDRFLQRPPAEVRAALIHGRDRGVVRDRADALAAKVTARPDDPFDVALLTEGDLDEGSGPLAEALSARSLGGGRRLVRLKLTGEKVGTERAAAEALSAHAEGAFDPDAFLLIEAGALGRESALRKTGEKAGACAVIPCYDDEVGDVARLAREALAADGIRLSSEALQLFVGRLPRDRDVARREIERLALYLGPGQNISADVKDLEPFLGPEAGASLSEAASDSFGGRTAAAQSALRRAAAGGEGGPAAVRALGAHAARLRKALIVAQGGISLPEAAKKAGVFWKEEREFVRQASAWSLAELDGLSPQLLDADRACKSAGAPDAIIAERLAMVISMRARRLGL